MLIFLDVIYECKRKAALYLFVKLPLHFFKKNYFDFEPPQEVGWEGEKYWEYWKKMEGILIPNESYLGIHIRRTDHSVAIKESSTDSFIRKINEMITQNKDMKIFLATDDK